MSKKYKIGVNENLTSIYTYIKSSPNYVYLYDVVQFCIDYDCYIEFYMNYKIIYDYIVEHNKIYIACNSKKEDKK